MKKLSFRGFALVLTVAILLSACAVMFGVAADAQPTTAVGLTEGVTGEASLQPTAEPGLTGSGSTDAASQPAAETQQNGNENGELDSQYTPISSSPTTSPHNGDYYSDAADMNRDMVLNSADARFILRLAARIEWVKQPRYLPAGTIFGDIDENGKVNAADARWALRVAAKLNTVPEVIEQTLKKPEPTKPAVTTSEDEQTQVAPTATTTTAAPTTTKNPLELEMPICEEFVVKMKSSEGVSYLVASDGLTCYIKSDDLIKGFSVMVDRSGSIYVLNDSDQVFTEFGAKFAGNNLGITAENVRNFVKSVAVPEFGVFEDCKQTTEVIKDIPFTVAERDGVKFYFYADGELTKITAKTLKDKATSFTVSEYSADAEKYITVPEGYASKNSNEFILRYGIDFLLNKF
ncbi:MAG: hypothetical protein IK118_07270 [Clostridia bacterium]|nr:hypothetical protein [Clostridia bacterium]MBR5428131.1 hypothetical protein [Clostridia bacterium]